MTSGFNFHAVNNNSIHEGYSSGDDLGHRIAVSRGRPQHLKIRMWTMTTKVLTIFGISFPFLAVLLGLAVTFNVHDDVAFNITECDKIAANFVSMSVVGSLYPQKFVWNFAVFTYAMARAHWGLNYFFVFKHCSAYSSSALWYRVFNKLIFLQTGAELLGLFVVISVTIEEHFPLHALGYGIFLLAACSHMVSVTSLHYTSGLIDGKYKTFYVKLLITILMIIGSLGMLFVYPTHATFCWEWGYPIFMTLEYSTVFFSTIFHALIYFDLGDFRLEVIGSWNSFDMPAVCI